MINDILTLTVKHPRYGYRRITIVLREDGWRVNFKRGYRLWCQESLKVPKRQIKRLFLGTSDHACDRHRPEHFNHVWSYDLLTERLENGRRVKLLTVIDEYTRECLARIFHAVSESPGGGRIERVRMVCGGSEG